MEEESTFTFVSPDNVSHEALFREFSDKQVILTFGTSKFAVKASNAAEFFPLRTEIIKFIRKQKPLALCLDDILDDSAVALLLQFTDTRKIDITQDNVYSILQAAEYLQQAQVRNACLAFLMKELNIHTVTRMYISALEYKVVSLMNITKRYIRKRFQEYSCYSYYLSLPYHSVKEIIAEEELNVTREDVVFQVATRWCSKILRGDWRRLIDLLTEVRMDFISYECLMDALREELITEQEIKKLISQSLLKYGRNQCGQPRKHFKYDFFAVCQNNLYTSLYVCDIVRKKWTILSMKESTAPLYHAAIVNEEMYAFYQSMIEIFTLATHEKKLIAVKGYVEGEEIVLFENVFWFFGSRSNGMGSIRTFNTANLKFGEEFPMPNIRLHSAAVTLGQFIYITGGVKLSSSHLSSVEKYNPSLNEWFSDVAAMQTERAHHSCTTIKAKIYVCGGKNSKQVCLSTCEMLDPLANQWTSISKMMINRVKPSLISYYGRIFAIGGIERTETQTREVFETYDLQADQWKLGFTVPQNFKIALLMLSDW